MPGTQNKNSLNYSYAHNAPKILLEVISARATLIILGTTYLTFLLAFSFDVITTLQNASNGDKILSSRHCDEMDINAESLWNTDGQWGCTLESTTNSQIWVGHIGNVTNVISVALRISNRNESFISLNETEMGYIFDKVDDMYMTYNIALYACMKSTGCSNSYGHNIESSWQPVVTMSDARISYNELFVQPNVEDPSVIHMEYTLLGNTFQNQESLPTKGNIRSYLVIVEYFNDIDIIQVNKLHDRSIDIMYQFLLISRSTSYNGNVFRGALLAITLGIMCWYVTSLYQHNPMVTSWLHERKWIVLYFIALILYQNPVYCVICWWDHVSVEWIFASYALDNLAQAAFFYVWLLFSDSLSRKFKYVLFYFPKVTMAALLFLSEMVVIVMQFPSVNPTTDRSASLAVYNWSKNTKILFIAFSIGYFVLVCVWMIWWLINLSSTANHLSKLSYMNTRYLQLSFRFFYLQSILLWMYYILEYVVVGYIIFHNSPPIWHQNIDNLTDSINTLFRHQTLLDGKVVFLTVYSIILGYLFLPPSYSSYYHIGENSNDSTGYEGRTTQELLATTYTVTENEMSAIVKKKKKALSESRNMSTALSSLYDNKIEVFCLDVALLLLEAAYEAYYDTLIKTNSGYGEADWKKHGYVFVDHMYDVQLETYCMITRHVATNKLVVAFRGSSGKQHWQQNLQYLMKEVDIAAMTFPEMDADDGLQVAQQIEFTVADLDNDLDDDHNCVGGAYTQDHAHGVNPIGAVTATLKEVANNMVGATTSVMGATSDFLTAAASHTPMVSIAKTYVHSGFWDSYAVAREFVNRTLRKELSAHPPTEVYFTGHSLGGALAAFGALDFTLHSLGRVNKYLKYKLMSRQFHAQQRHAPTLHVIRREDPLPTVTASPRHFVRVGMYSFGAPKIGNWAVTQLYNRLVPNSFRTIVDGDIVPGLPPTYAYSHVGTEIVVDAQGAGSIIVDPSFVERRLRTKIRASLFSHAMALYRGGLNGVKEASLYMQCYVQKHEKMLQENKNHHPQSHIIDHVAYALRRNTHHDGDSDFLLIPQESVHTTPPSSPPTMYRRDRDRSDSDTDSSSSGHGCGVSGGGVTDISMSPSCPISSPTDENSLVGVMSDVDVGGFTGKQEHESTVIGIIRKYILGIFEKNESQDIELVLHSDIDASQPPISDNDRELNGLISPDPYSEYITDSTTLPDFQSLPTSVHDKSTMPSDRSHIRDKAVQFRNIPFPVNIRE